MITTPREASGSANGGSRTIFAGGCSIVSGITWAGLQMSVGLWAAAVIAYNTMPADSKDAPFFRCDISFLQCWGFVYSRSRNRRASIIEALLLPCEQLASR